MNNQPAFPRTGYTDTRSGSLPDGDEVIRHNDGMTLRDYFAAKAMQAMLSNPYTGEEFHKQNATKQDQVESIVRNSFDVADAMLKARDQ